MVKNKRSSTKNDESKSDDSINSNVELLKLEKQLEQASARINPEYQLKHYEHNVGLLKFYLEFVWKIAVSFFALAGAVGSFYFLHSQARNGVAVTELQFLPGIVTLIGIFVVLGLAFLAHKLYTFEIETLYLKSLTSTQSILQPSSLLGTIICWFITLLIAAFICLYTFYFVGLGWALVYLVLIVSLNFTLKRYMIVEQRLIDNLRKKNRKVIFEKE